jgi:glycosyltransferase involved in cell wall biosynthesis
LATFGPLFDGVCAAAPLEASAIRQRFGFEVAVVRNAVVVPAEITRQPAVPPELLFVGNLDYPPNVEAATALATRIVPAVASALHRPVNVNLVGPHGPGQSIQALGRLPGIRLTGYVEDLAPLYERASAVVVPLARGGGTSIKVLEAFARGVPVVSTRAGVRGLGVEDGTHVLLGESTGDLAASVAALLRDPPWGARLARAAREFVERDFTAPLADREAAAFLLSAAASAGERPNRPDPRAAAVPDTAGSR